MIARFRPLAQRGGLDAVRVVVRGPEVGIGVADLVAARFPAMLDAGARDFEGRWAAGEFVDQFGAVWGPTEPAHRSREIFFHRDLAPEEVEEVQIPVIAEDEHLLVVDKPPGMASIPRGEHVRRSALVRLRVAHDCPDLSPLHRLDRWTSGLLAFSKIPAERGAYQRLFAERMVHKEYRALTHLPPAGTPLPAAVGEAFEVRAPIRKEHGDMWAHVDERGKSAHSTVRILEVNRAAARALVHLVPHTGRTHQLRVHLNHVSLPIVGDDLYPMPEPDPATGERKRRVGGAEPLQLLSALLAFTDPVTGQERRFVSERRLGAVGADGAAGIEKAARTKGERTR